MTTESDAGPVCEQATVEHKEQPSTGGVLYTFAKGPPEEGAIGFAVPWTSRKLLNEKSSEAVVVKEQLRMPDGFPAASPDTQIEEDQEKQLEDCGTNAPNCQGEATEDETRFVHTTRSCGMRIPFLPELPPCQQGCL